MYNITLIGTHHSELGKCNADELYKIIQFIDPEVIFEELPQDLFDRVHKENQLPEEPTEVKAVRKYLLNHNIKNIPVDVEVNQNIIMRDIHYLFDAFEKYNVYKVLEAEQCKRIAIDGFAFLNSQEYMDLFEKKKKTELALMEVMMNKNGLMSVHKLFYDKQRYRESEMLRNIYDYSKEHTFGKAIFLIGAGHRKSIMQKIKEYERRDDPKLNWTFYDNTNP